MDIFDLLGFGKIKKSIMNAQSNAAQGPLTLQEQGVNALGPLGLLLGSPRQKELGQAGLEAASFAAPMGKGANLLSRFALPGAVSGGLRGMSQDNPTIQSVAGNAAGGAAGAGITGGLLGLLGKAGSKLTNEVPEKLMNTVFKEGAKQTKAAVKGGETLGQMALKRGVKGVSDDAILQQATGKMQVLEDSLQTALKDSSDTVDITDLINSTKTLLEKYVKSGNTSASNAITSRIEAIRQGSGDKIPVALANEVKRSLYEEVGNKFGQMASEETEGLKAIARTIKEVIAKKVPGVSQINEELGFNGRLRDSLVNKIAKSSGKSGFNLTDIVLGGAGNAAFGPAGLTAVAGKKILSSTPGATGLANMLSQAGKSVSESAAPDILSQILGIGGAQAGAGLSGGIMPELPQQTQNQYGKPEDPSGNYLPNNTKNGVNNVNTPPESLLHNSNSIPQGQQKPLKDGDTDPSGEWKFDAKKGDFVPNTEAQGGSGKSGITKETIGQAMLMDLLKNKGQNVDKLAKISEFLVPDDKDKKKTPSAASLQVKGKATAALSALDNVENLMKEDPNVLVKAAIPGAPGARQYESAISSITDAVGGLRTGASVSKEQQAFYRNLLPKIGDSPDTVKKKLKAIRDELGVYLDGSSGIEDPLQSMLTP